MGNVILINAPSFAGFCWSIAKKFLDPKTASKFAILVGPSKDTLKQLCGEIVLPEEYGGTNPYVLPHPVKKVDEKFNELYPL